MNDPILKMTEEEVEQACRELLGAHPTARDEYVVGLMIQKLQEWEVCFDWNHTMKKRWFSKHATDRGIWEDSLQVCFLRTALALGHWSPPVKELTIEERVARLEAFVKSQKNTIP